jgi:hypothetical protein
MGSFFTTKNAKSSLTRIRDRNDQNMHLEPDFKMIREEE